MSVLPDRRAAASSHDVQFYDTEAFLLASVLEFLRAGREAGEGILIIATQAHLNALSAAFAREGERCPWQAGAANCIAMEANEALSRIMHNGEPDRQAFQSMIDEFIERLSGAEDQRGRVRIYGEMVDLLYLDGKTDAAMQLETFWNDTVERHGIALLCACPMSALGGAAGKRAFLDACGVHDHVHPPERHAASGAAGDLLRTIAELEKKARTLEFEVSRRKQAEAMLGERERALLRRTAELTEANQRLLAEIEKRRRTEEALVHAQHVLTSAQRVSHVGSWEFDVATRSLQCSDEFFRICGLAPQSIEPTLELTVELTHPVDRRAAHEAILSTVAGGRPYYIEKRIIRPDGEVRHVISQGEGLFDDAGRLLKVVGSYLDVTDQKLAQQALADSEARFRSLVNLSSDWYWEQDVQMRFTSILHHGSKTLGADTSRMIGHTLWDIRGANWNEPERQKLMAMLAARQPFHDFEYSHTDLNGGVVSLEISGQPMHDATGRFTGYRGIAKDVTERMRRARELYLFRSAMDATLDGILLCDRSGSAFFDVNATACRMLGYSREELMAIAPEAVKTRSRAELAALYAQLDEGGTPQVEETWLRRKDGSMFLVEMERRLLHRDQSWIIVTVAHDITERKQAEQALRQSGETMRRLAAHEQRIREEERKRIAREVHDELGGLLTCIKAYVSVAIDHAAAAGAAPDRLLCDAADLSDQAINTVRRVIADLRPSVLDELGIWAALEWYAKQLGKRAGIACSCIIDEESQAVEVDPERSTVVFRIVQEALTNVVRHSGASNAAIRVMRREDALVVEIEDNGCGIAPERLINKESWGMLGMHERAAHVGATLNIMGRPAQGALVSLSLPLDCMNA